MCSLVVKSNRSCRYCSVSKEALFLFLVTVCFLIHFLVYEKTKKIYLYELDYAYVVPAVDAASVVNTQVPVAVLEVKKVE